jgi:hypothetical protein
MASKRPVAPDTPVRSFPTPNINDLVVILDVDSRLPGYKPLDYGTPHPDQTRFPGAKLVYQEPLDGSDQFVRRIYATDRVNQDAYNYAVKYSAGSPNHPVYIRTYVEPRADYFPLPEGVADSYLENAYLVEEEMAPVEGELNSLYVRVTRVFETLPGPVLTSFETNDAGQKVTVTTQRKSSAGYSLPNASATSSPSAQAEDTGVVTEQVRSVPSIFTRKQFSAERPDPLPTKFRAAVPDVETSEIVSGTAQQPTLDVPEDLSASETQESLFLKRVSRRLRPNPVYPFTFEETTRTNTGQLATTVSTLDEGVQTADTGPLVESSEVTDLGDGRSIKVTTEVDQVFEQPSFTRVKEDLTPQKFRATVSETIEERTIPGTALMPATLTGDEISKTEEQLTVDRKRVRTQERNIATADPLVEKVVTPEGQLATRTLTLSNQQQTVAPSATLIQGEVEQLGDGRTVKTEVVVSEVFDERRVAKEKPDLVPPEFRGAVPTEITEVTEAGGSVSMPTLGPGELSRSAQRITAQKIRTSVSTRPSTALPVTLTPSDTLIDNDGVVITRVKTLASGSQTISPSATVSGTVENIGDGLTVKTEDTRAEIFAGSSFTRTKEDLTPAKFRASVAEQVEESTTAGTASMPQQLLPEEYEKTEQQVTKFTKRTRVRRRQIGEEDEIEEQVITGDGQVATRRLTLVDGPQTIEASAVIVSGEVEKLGDGRTVKTEIEVPEVFARRVYAQERPDVIPVQFRDQIPTTTTEVTEAGQAAPVSLVGDEISKTQEQVNAHTRRTRVITRSDSLTTDSLVGRAFNTEWGVPELISDQIVDPDTPLDPSGLIVQDEITPLSSSTSRRVRRVLQSVPANYFYYEVAQDQVVIKNEVSLHRRDVTDVNDPTFLPVPVITGPIADITDTPLEFPWVRRVTKRLPTNALGEIILPEARIEYDTITYTFPGIIYTWKARYTGDQVRANLSFFDNRYPVSMTVASRNEVTFHVLDAGDPDDDPDLNLSNPAARNNFDFFRVITRPWARIFFNIPDNTIHPPAPITLAKESVDRGGVAFDIQGGQSSEPVAYTPGDLILVGGEVKKYWGNIYTKRLVYVREPV